MTTHHTSLYDDETNPAPAMVLKQELFTTEQTEYGVRFENCNLKKNLIYTSGYMYTKLHVHYTCI